MTQAHAAGLRMADFQIGTRSGANAALNNSAVSRLTDLLAETTTATRLMQAAATLPHMQAAALRLTLPEPLLRDFPQWLTTRESETCARLSRAILGQTSTGVASRLSDYLPPFVAPHLVIPRPAGFAVPDRPRAPVAGIVIPKAARSLSPFDASLLWVIKAFLSRDDLLWLAPNLLGDPLAVATVALGFVLNASGDPALMTIAIVLLGYAGTDIFTRIDRHRRGKD